MLHRAVSDGAAAMDIRYHLTTGKRHRSTWRTETGHDQAENGKGIVNRNFGESVCVCVRHAEKKAGSGEIGTVMQLSTSSDC